MSTPTTRQFPPSGAGGDVPEFLAAVWAQLDDLPADEVAELTGGLEADLTDALADSGGTPAQLYGDPVEYARELRAAAGLPPRDAAGAPGRSRPSAGEQIEELVATARERTGIVLRGLDRQPWWPGLRDLLVVLRPAWWVIRAWVAVQVLYLVFGAGGGGAVRGGLGGLLLLLVAILISAQLGRRAPSPDRRERVLVTVGNVVAVLFLLPVMFSASGPYPEAYGSPQTVNEDYPWAAGLNNGNQAVTNVFPYDAEGRPLTGVQLYDQDGRPLEVAEENRSGFDESTQQSFDLVPGSPEGSAPRWNSFPLQQRLINPDTGQAGPIGPVPLPLTGVPSSAGSATGSVAPTVAPTGTPTTTPTGTPTGTPTTTPTVGPTTTPSRTAVPGATPGPVTTATPSGSR